MSTTVKLDAIVEQARQKTFDAEKHADNEIALAMHRMLHDPVLWRGMKAIYVENGMLFQRALRGYIKDYIALE